MLLFKQNKFAIALHEGKYYRQVKPGWDKLVNKKGLYKALLEILPTWEPVEPGIFQTDSLEPPIGAQEIWASGVTYLRSKEARMEESKKAGGGSFYDRVYDADRPELFFKSTAARCVGHGDHVFIRKDSTWNVPEPELTLFFSSKGTLEGYTIGNDMSSRSIEGENPLYLPQAKTYDRSAALGPCLYVPPKPLSPATQISLEIQRNGKIVFNDSVRLDRMKRSFTELGEYLFRACTFPKGCYLMTGTGIVPPDNFTLEAGDIIHISIDHIGTLTNTVALR